jgi:hypothetical protein
LRVIDIITTELLALTNDSIDLAQYVPDQPGLGHWEGILIIFHGDHTSTLKLGNASGTKYLPIPPGSMLSYSAINRDQFVAKNLLNLSAQIATSCTITICLEG